MKLDSDCVRDVLLSVEKAAIDEYISPRTLHSAMPQYTEDEISYTCLILSDGGFLEIMAFDAPGREIPAVKSIVRMTYQGHELLAKIRDKDRWGGIKKALPAIRNYSIDAINAVSEGMTSAAIAALIQTNR